MAAATQEGEQQRQQPRLPIPPLPTCWRMRHAALASTTDPTPEPSRPPARPLQGRVGILKVHARDKKVDPNLGERHRLWFVLQPGRCRDDEGVPVPADGRARQAGRGMHSVFGKPPGGAWPLLCPHL